MTQWMRPSWKISRGVTALLAGCAAMVGCAGLCGCSAAADDAPPVQQPIITHGPRADKPRRATEPIEVTLPDLPANASCQRARAAYVERWQLAAGDIPPDLSRGQLASVLGNGGYVKACRVPDNYEVHVCAAIHDGRVRGATVKTKPRAPHLARCVDKRVRALSFPRSGRMDITKTVFRTSR